MTAKHVAKETPDKLLVMAIDGSDQSSYCVPYFAQTSKDDLKGWRMPYKLVGSLVSERLLHFCTIGTNWESGTLLVWVGFLGGCYRWLLPVV